jgi:hypothetical protein
MTLTDPLPDRLHQLPQQGLEEGGVEAVGIIMEEVSNALEGVDNGAKRLVAARIAP